ncbi:MAG: hypothetical protein ACO31E_07205, partial [Phycisphaerales bacterium]
MRLSAAFGNRLPGRLAGGGALEKIVATALLGREEILVPLPSDGINTRFFRLLHPFPPHRRSGHLGLTNVDFSIP